MNTITKAWCRYVGINANCWEFISDRLHFGGNDGAVYQAEIGLTDNGATISAQAKQAFSYFGDPGTQKRFTGARPVVTALSPGAVGLRCSLRCPLCCWRQATRRALAQIFIRLKMKMMWCIFLICRISINVINLYIAFPPRWHCALMHGHPKCRSQLILKS